MHILLSKLFFRALVTLYTTFSYKQFVATNCLITNQEKVLISKKILVCDFKFNIINQSKIHKVITGSCARKAKFKTDMSNVLMYNFNSYGNIFSNNNYCLLKYKAYPIDPMWDDTAPAFAASNYEHLLSKFFVQQN